MELTHSFTVPTSVDDAWSMLMDLERVGGCFPGATVTEVSEDGFSGTVKVKLGPIALVYAGSGSFVARDDAQHRAVIEAKGKDKRGNGTAGATVTVQLSPDGAGAKADVVTDLAVTGKPAQFGRGVMQDVSDKLLHAFVACIQKQFAAGPTPSSEQSIPSPAPSSEQSIHRPAAPTPSSEQSVPSPAAPTPSSEQSVPTPAPSSEQSIHRPAAESEDDALDLGSAVLPVLMQRYAGYAGAGVIGLVLGWLVGRTRSRSTT